MEHLIAFFLGIVSGAIIVALYYSVDGVHKLKTKTKNTDDHIHGLDQALGRFEDNFDIQIRELQDHTSREVDEIYQKLDEITKNFERKIDKNFDFLNSKIKIISADVNGENHLSQDMLKS